MQLDEKWSFVGKKQRHCDPADEDDLFAGDQWDHVAYDPEHRLVLAVVVGKRIEGNAEMLLGEVRARLGGGCPGLVMTDGLAAYEGAILGAFGEWVTPPRTGRPGRPALPRLEPPEELCYARVLKRRRGGALVSVERELVFGAARRLEEALAGSGVCEVAGTSHLERYHATDRHRCARKVRKSYRFSRDWEVHWAVTAFGMFSYNFCWPVRTLREPDPEGGYLQRSPAMAAGLADHVWTYEEWLTLPAFQH